MNEMCVKTSGFANYTNMSNFHPLEVVGRGSGKQFQMGENLKVILFY